MNKSICTIITGLLLALPAIAGYIENPLITIPWGDEPNQLKLQKLTHNNSSEDSTDDIGPGRGPNHAFVDINGNLIFASYGFRQIKGFESNGHLLFDFSAGISLNFNEACQGLPTNIYVDSNLNVYITSFEAMPYVAIINYSGEIVSKLYPYPDSATSKISRISWSPYGHVYFREKKRGWITYFNGEFSKSGCKGQLASNGYFYDAYMKPSYPHNLYIGKFNDIDTLGHPGYSDIKTIELPLSGCDTLYFTSIEPGGNGNSIYIFAIIDSCDTYYDLIWQYDLEFNKLNELRLPSNIDSFYVHPSPFIGPDGSIYEFRTYDDGLHVIKWTKE
jgi:hypothetical protein